MEKEKQLVIDIISESFDDNKSVNYVVKQDSSRVKRIQSLIAYSYNICKKYGQVVMNEDQTAVALLNYPLTKKAPLFEISQNIQLVLKTIGVKKLSSVLKRESLIKSNHPDVPFCHLWYIGVAKSEQGKGIGTQLLQSIIQKHSDLKMSIYLETSMDQNVPWYEENGFSVYKENEDFGFTTYMIKKIS